MLVLRHYQSLTMVIHSSAIFIITIRGSTARRPDLELPVNSIIVFGPCRLIPVSGLLVAYLLPSWINTRLQQGAIRFSKASYIRSYLCSPSHGLWRGGKGPDFILLGKLKKIYWDRSFVFPKQIQHCFPLSPVDQLLKLLLDWLDSFQHCYQQRQGLFLLYTSFNNPSDLRDVFCCRVLCYGSDWRRNCSVGLCSDW